MTPTWHNGPQASLLPDGKRLHLHQGPSDLIIEAYGPGRDAAYVAAAARFKTLLADLVGDLDVLREQTSANLTVSDPIAQAMVAATLSIGGGFVTPMAAVAGAIADAVLSAMREAVQLPKAYVNNGGDIAFHIAPGEQFRTASLAGTFEIDGNSAARGIATSGWGGRSFSLGIADAVTVIASSAAQADVAATLIANAVDLPGHPGIERMPANELAPESDLGARQVTTNVASLSAGEIADAMASGLARAEEMREKNNLIQAVITLQGVTRSTQTIDQGIAFHA